MISKIIGILLLVLFSLTSHSLEGPIPIENPQETENSIYYSFEDYLLFNNPQPWNGTLLADSLIQRNSYINDASGLMVFSTVIRCKYQLWNWWSGQYPICDGIDNRQGAKTASINIDTGKHTIFAFDVHVLLPNANDLDRGQIVSLGDYPPRALHLSIYGNSPVRPNCISTETEVLNWNVGSNVRLLRYVASNNMAAGEVSIHVVCDQPLSQIGVGRPAPSNYGSAYGFLNYALIKGISLIKSPSENEEPTSMRMVSVNLGGDGAEVGSTQKIQNVKDGQSLKLTLGSVFKVGLVDDIGNPIPATYRVAGDPNFTAARIPVDQNGLFANVVAFLFGKDSDQVDKKAILPTHLGQQDLIITPNDSINYRPITLKVTVARPTAVGTGKYDCSYVNPDGSLLDSEYSNCDELIIDFANAKGVLPQVIKAEIWQESFKHSFLKSSYRYEPNNDRDYFYNLAGKNRKYPWKKRDDFSGYFFFLDSKGDNLSIRNTHVRSLYRYLVSGALVPIPDNYETSFEGIAYKPLSAWEIVRANTSQNWFKKSKPTSSDFNFVAQTSVAASYGIMQIMYPTAVDYGYNDGVGSGLDPVGLFRPKSAVGVSLSFWAKSFTKFKDRFSGPIIADFGTYLRIVDFASRGYNAGISGDTNSNAYYGKSILKQASLYWILNQPAL